MTDVPVANSDAALLRAVNAAASLRRILNAIVADAGIELDEDDADAVRRAEADEDDADAVRRAEADEAACMAHLETTAAKCPGCRQAFAFQRQKKRPDRCSWCGYDHATGRNATLVPASDGTATPTAAAAGEPPTPPTDPTVAAALRPSADALEAIARVERSAARPIPPILLD